MSLESRIRKTDFVLTPHSAKCVLHLVKCSSHIAKCSLNVQAATLSPELQSQIAGISDDGSVGVVIVSFDTSSGLNESHINVLRGIGVDSGVTFQNLGMVGAVLNAGQVRALASNTSVRSIWTNDELSYYMNQARVVTGTDKIRTDSAMTLRNGGMPVSGSDRGDLGRSAV